MKLTDEQKQFFAEANFVHLAMLRTDGSPQVAPVWADLDGDNVVISTNENSSKIKAMRNDPRVALSITREHDPYHELHARGRVVEIRKEGAGPRMHEISNKYIGRDFPMGVDHQVTVVIEIDQVNTRKIPFEPKKG